MFNLKKKYFVKKHLKLEVLTVQYMECILQGFHKVPHAL